MGHVAPRGLGTRRSSQVGEQAVAYPAGAGQENVEVEAPPPLLGHAFSASTGMQPLSVDHQDQSRLQGHSSQVREEDDDDAHAADNDDDCDDKSDSSAVSETVLFPPPARGQYREARWTVSRRLRTTVNTPLALIDDCDTNAVSWSPAQFFFGGARGGRGVFGNASISERIRV